MVSKDIQEIKRQVKIEKLCLKYHLKYGTAEKIFDDFDLDSKIKIEENDTNDTKIIEDICEERKEHEKIQICSDKAQESL